MRLGGCLGHAFEPLSLIAFSSARRTKSVLGISPRASSTSFRKSLSKEIPTLIVLGINIRRDTSILKDCDWRIRILGLSSATYSSNRRLRLIGFSDGRHGFSVYLD